jgi:hypothetical protein
MLWKPKSRAGKPSRESWVAPIDLPKLPPSADLVRWIISVLQTEGSMAWSDLVLRVAQRLYYDALRHGAASVDIGLFGERLFNAEAAAVLERGNGLWWANGAAEPTSTFAAVGTGRRPDEVESLSRSDA